MSNESNPGVGNPIKVTVTAEPGPVFSETWQDADKPNDPPQHGPIECPYDSGSHVISFHLADHSGLGLQFASSAEEAIWVSQSGSDCPKGVGNGGQILFPYAPSNHLLKVVNRNSGDACELHYQLNFLGTDGKPYPHDPIIKNGGGVQN
jgi:hypothetical protein